MRFMIECANRDLVKMSVSPPQEHDFYEIVRFTVDTLWKVLGMPWEVLGTPWVDVWGSLGDALGSLEVTLGGLGDALGGLGDTLEDLLGGPWKNLGRTSWKSLQNPRRNPNALRSTSF